jgi:hypothetical protein
LPCAWFQPSAFPPPLLDVLKLPPILHHRKVNEIIGIFGGADQLSDAKISNHIIEKAWEKCASQNDARGRCSVPFRFRDGKAINHSITWNSFG